MLENGGNPRAELLHFRFFHAAGCDGCRADPDAGRDERTLGIKRDGVLVADDTCIVQRRRCHLARDARSLDINEEKVIVGAAGDQTEPFILQHLGKRLGVGNNL